MQFMVWVLQQARDEQLLPHAQAVLSSLQSLYEGLALTLSSAHIKFATCIFTALQGSPHNCSHIPYAERRSKVSLRAAGAWHAIEPACIVGWHTETQGSTDAASAALRGFAYQAIGQLAMRAPDPFQKHLGVASDMFQALATEPPGVRASLQEAISCLASAYQGCSGSSHRPALGADNSRDVPKKALCVVCHLGQIGSTHQAQHCCPLQKWTSLLRSQKCECRSHSSVTPASVQGLIQKLACRRQRAQH